MILKPGKYLCKRSLRSGCYQGGQLYIKKKFRGSNGFKVVIEQIQVLHRLLLFNAV